MRGAGLNCPVCAVPLAMSAREGIEIDYCPTCRGVWLDRGELDKIVERSSRDAPAGPVREDGRNYQADRHDDRTYRPDRHHPHGKKRKSFFEELFD